MGDRGDELERTAGPVDDGLTGEHALPPAGFADPLAVTRPDERARSGPAAPAVASGATIDRYVVGGVLGAGGMGVVYAAHDPDLDRPIAIKVLRPEARAARARLLREGQAIAKLNHPNVVTVHDVGVHGDDLFIAMELVRGQTLGAWLSGAPDKARPWREVLARLGAAGRGLAAAHAAGLVHRDFKPENVICTEAGRVVVTDFGLAQLELDGHARVAPLDLPALGQADLTRTGVVLGTPAYMAPEQFRGERADARADQFAFAVTLYEALYGVRPFDPRDGSEPSMTGLAAAVERGDIAPPPPGRKVPRWLWAVVARGLRRDPAARYPSMDALLAALEPPRRRGPILVGGGVAIGAAAIAFVIARGARADRSPTSAPRPAPAACGAAATAAIGSIWSADARARYRAGRADRSWIDEELGWFDDYATRWVALRTATCAAGDAAGDTARAQTCLDDARARFAAALARTNDFWPLLPALDDCARAPIHVAAFPPALALGPQGVASLAPDGRHLAVSNFAEPPFVIAADPTAFAPSPIAGARVVGDWLADGRVLIQRADGTQALRRADGGDDPLPGRGDLLYTQINTLAPDGRRIAVQAADAVEILAVPDGAVLARVPGLAHEIAWEPDGHRVAIVARDLGTLHLLDTRTGVVVDRSLRLHTRGLGEVGIAWLAPGQLVLAGGFDATSTFALISLALDDASALRRGPELRWTPPTGQLIRVFDAGAGRLLLETSSSRQRLYRWHGDRSTELPAQLNDLRLTAVDVARGLALGAGTDALITFDLRSSARTVVPGGGWLSPALHEGRVEQIEERGGGRWALVEIGADGARRERRVFDWPEGHGAPLLRCSPLDGARCVLAARDRTTLDVAALTDDGHGPITTIDDVSWNPDVSADGDRVLVPENDGGIVEVALATGARRELARVDAPECKTRSVRWIGRGPGVVAVLLCPDRFAIELLAHRQPARELVHSDGWIGGIEALPDGDLVYSVMDWDPQLAILDGLTEAP